ncbi:MAG: hypothetical protein Wins2KO_13320 [Winogradskyella sp.]
MRDLNRITETLNHLERIWKANPDFRLGQLLVIATKSKEPCRTVFYKEDHEMLEGLLEFETKTNKSI